MSNMLRYSDGNPTTSEEGNNEHLQIWSRGSDVAGGWVILECYHLLSNKQLSSFVISVVTFSWGQMVRFYSLTLKMKA
jgi:hypothetical protein